MKPHEAVGVDWKPCGHVLPGNHVTYPWEKGCYITTLLHTLGRHEWESDCKIVVSISTSLTISQACPEPASCPQSANWSRCSAIPPHREREMVAPPLQDCAVVSHSHHCHKKWVCEWSNTRYRIHYTYITMQVLYIHVCTWTTCTVDHRTILPKALMIQGHSEHRTHLSQYQVSWATCMLRWTESMGITCTDGYMCITAHCTLHQSQHSYCFNTTWHHISV